MGEIFQRKEVWERFEWQGGREMEVVSPMAEETINPPDGWLAGSVSNVEICRHNPLADDNGKTKPLWDLRQSEFGEWAYYAGVLGLEETQRFFQSYL